jgi:Ca-activated chloride channel homolog
MKRSGILGTEHRASPGGWRQHVSRRLLRPMWFTLAAFVLAAMVSGPVFAEVTVRVEARPISDPINVFVTVTNGGGNPVGGLTADDFTVLVDGVPVISPMFGLSPIQDADQQVSVVFAMDYSQSTLPAQQAMEESVLAFLAAMEIGDYVSIIKFNETNPQRVAVLAPFTRIDKASGSTALAAAVTTPFAGSGSPVIDAVNVAIQQFAAPMLPLKGPRVVVLVSDGGDNSSINTGSQVAQLANDQGISIFSIGVGPELDDPVRNRPNITGRQLLQELTFQTGGAYYEAPSNEAIADAYDDISTLLQNEYVLTFASNINDCNEHTVEVRVTAFAPATSTFTRCTAPGSSTPPPQGDVPGTPAPPPSSGGGGGGAFGPLGLIGSLALLALVRRRSLPAA